MFQISEGPAEATHEVRRAVLRLGKPHENVVKKGDPEGIHLLAVAAGETIGVVSCARSVDGWQLYQMAVVDKWQGAGVGRALVVALIDRVRQRGGTAIWANARNVAIPFYEKLGFESVGEEFPGWTGIPHHKVIRDLR